MKKSLIYVLAIIPIILFIMLSTFVIRSLFPELFENYSNWQTVTIIDYGTIRIPSDWKFEENDGYLLFYLEGNENTSKQYTLVQYAKDGGYINRYFSDIIDRVSVLGVNYGNSAGFLKHKIMHSNGFTEERNGVSFFVSTNEGGNTINFYLLDGSVSEKTLKKIAISYVMK